MPLVRVLVLCADQQSIATMKAVKILEEIMGPSLPLAELDIYSVGPNVPTTTNVKKNNCTALTFDYLRVCEHMFRDQAPFDIVIIEYCPVVGPSTVITDIFLQSLPLAPWGKLIMPRIAPTGLTVQHSNGELTTFGKLEDFFDYLAVFRLRAKKVGKGIVAIKEEGGCLNRRSRSRSPRLPLPLKLAASILPSSRVVSPDTAS